MKPATQNEDQQAVCEQLKREIRSSACSWYRIGSLLQKAIEIQVPASMGLTANQWLSDFDCSRSKLYRAIKIIKALWKFPEEKLSQLSEGNAFLLSRLPEGERFREEWYQLAKMLKTNIFKERVDKFLGRKGQMHEEPFARVTLQMPVSMVPTFNEAIQKSARIHEIDIEATPGMRFRALEAIVVNYLQQDEGVLRAEAE